MAALTIETLRTMLRETIGAEFGDAELERLRPMVERQLERMRELHALDLGREDPRTMRYINDRRLLK
jgi:hypothetical protein